MHHVDGTVAAKSKALRDYEKLKQYPPRLSLRVIRTPHLVKQGLKTVVTVTGVNPPVEFHIYAQSPGKYYLIEYQ